MRTSCGRITRIVAEVSSYPRLKSRVFPQPARRVAWARNHLRANRQFTVVTVHWPESRRNNTVEPQGDLVPHTPERASRGGGSGSPRPCDRPRTPWRRRSDVRRRRRGRVDGIARNDAIRGQRGRDGQPNSAVEPVPTAGLAWTPSQIHLPPCSAPCAVATPRSLAGSNRRDSFGLHRKHLTLEEDG